MSTAASSGGDVRHASAGPWLGSAADDAYALPLAVLLRTAGETWTSDRGPLRVLVVDGGLSEASRKGLRATVEALPVEVEFGTIETAELHGLRPWRGSDFLTYARLLFPDLLPAGTERAVWLDADTLVRSSLADLWTTKLDGCPVGACRDHAVPRFSSPLGVYEYRRVGDGGDHPYFNAGLLVYDLERWRREDVTERTLSFLRQSRGRPVVVDQEALNVVLVSRWRELDALWNVTGGLAGRGLLGPRPRGRGEIDWRQARVVHFSGRIKPWKVRSGSLYQAEYEAAMERTSLAPTPEPSLEARLTSIYDRHLRRLGHPVERALIRLRRRWLHPWMARLETLRLHGGQR